MNDQYCTGMFSTIDGTYFDMLNDNATVSAGAYLNVLDWLPGQGGRAADLYHQEWQPCTFYPQ